MPSHVMAAVFFERYVRYFGSLHPAFEMSCDTEYLEKKQLLIFSETWSSSFWIVCNCFDDFRTNRPKNIGRSHRKENTNFPKWRWVRSKNVCLSSALLFSLVVNKKTVLEIPEISLQETIRVLCSNAGSRFGCGIFWTLCSVLWLFTSCVWDVLRYRILGKKTSFDFFGNVVFVVLDCLQLFWWFSYKPSEKYWAISPKGKHQLCKMTLSTFQKYLFELCFAFFFGCN